MIHPSRCHVLNDQPDDPSGKYVLYWMQQSQRAHFNHALEAAIIKANQLDLPVVVVFGLMDDYPAATARHYAFMIDGLADVENELTKRGIRFVCLHDEPKNAAMRLSAEAACVVCDRGYLNHLRAWRDDVADQCKVKVVEIESDLVVPVEAATDGAEYAARTIRPKINKLLQMFLVNLKPAVPKHHSLHLRLESDFDLSQPEKVLDKISCIRDVKRSHFFKGGYHAADKRINSFIANHLNGYADHRNEPAENHTSCISPYLQYGHISPVDITLRINNAPNIPAQDRDTYLEELIVRRELAHNHTWFNRNYDSYDSLPGWAKKSLDKHKSDPRNPQYTRQQLQDAQTHDPYWNAAQMQMVITGYMHNYMRMYWGKKILEWSSTPEYAFQTTLYLNNRFLLDGLNPNSYANVGWIFGLHDRPWIERPVFGQLRYMNSAGLERKFDIQRYVQQIEALANQCNH